MAMTVAYVLLVMSCSQYYQPSSVTQYSPEDAEASLAQQTQLEQELRQNMAYIHKQAKAAGLGRHLPQSMQTLFNNVLNDDYLLSVEEAMTALIDDQVMEPFLGDPSSDAYKRYKEYERDVALFNTKIISAVKTNKEIVTEVDDPSIPFGDPRRYRLNWPVNRVLRYFFGSGSDFISDSQFLIDKSSPMRRSQRISLILELANLYNEITIKKNELMLIQAQRMLRHQYDDFHSVPTFASWEEIDRMRTESSDGAMLFDDERKRVKKHQSYLFQRAPTLYSSLGLEQMIRIDRTPEDLPQEEQVGRLDKIYRNSQKKVRDFFYQNIVVELMIQGQPTDVLGEMGDFRFYNISSVEVWKAIIGLFKRVESFLPMMLFHIKNLLGDSDEDSNEYARIILFKLFGLDIDYNHYDIAKTYRPELMLEKFSINQPKAPSAKQSDQLERLMDNLFNPGEMEGVSFVGRIRSRLLTFPYITDNGACGLSAVIQGNDGKNAPYASAIVKMAKLLFPVIPKQENEDNDEPDGPDTGNMLENTKIITIFSEAEFHEFHWGALHKRDLIERIAAASNYFNLLTANVSLYLDLITYDYRGTEFDNRQGAVIAKFDKFARRLRRIIETFYVEIKEEIPIKTTDGKPFFEQTEDYISQIIADNVDENNQDQEGLYKFLGGYHIQGTYQEPKTMTDDEAKAVAKVNNLGKEKPKPEVDYASQMVMVKQFLKIRLEFYTQKLLIDASKHRGDGLTEDMQGTFHRFKEVLLTTIAIFRGLPGSEDELFALYDNLYTWCVFKVGILNMVTWYRNSNYVDAQEIVARLFLVKSDTKEPVADGFGNFQLITYPTYSVREDIIENPFYAVSKREPQLHSVVTSSLKHMNLLSRVTAQAKQNLRNIHLTISPPPTAKKDKGVKSGMPGIPGIQGGGSTDTAVFGEIIDHIHIGPQVTEEGKPESGPNKEFQEELKALSKLSVQAVKDLETRQKLHPVSQDTCEAYKIVHKFMDAWYAFSVKYNFVGKDRAVKSGPKSYRIELSETQPDSNQKWSNSGPYVFESGEFMWGLFRESPCSDIETYELPEFEANWPRVVEGDDAVIMPFMSAVAFSTEKEVVEDKSKIFIPVGSEENGCVPVRDDETKLYSIDSEKCPKFYLPKLHEYVWEHASNLENWAVDLIINVSVTMSVIVASNYLIGAFAVPYLQAFMALRWAKFVGNTFINPIFFTAIHGGFSEVGRRVFGDDRYQESKYFAKVKWTWGDFAFHAFHTTLVFGSLHLGSYLVMGRFYPWIKSSARRYKKIGTGRYVYTETAVGGAVAKSGIEAGAEAAARAGSAEAAAVAQAVEGTYIRMGSTREVVGREVRTARMLERVVPILEFKYTQPILTILTQVMVMTAEAMFISPAFSAYERGLDEAAEKGITLSWLERLRYVRDNYSMTNAFTELFMDNLWIFIGFHFAGHVAPAIRGAYRRHIKKVPEPLVNAIDWQRKRGPIVDRARLIGPDQFARRKVIEELRPLEELRSGKKSLVDMERELSPEEFEILSTRLTIYNEAMFRLQDQLASPLRIQIDLRTSRDVKVEDFSTQYLTMLQNELHLGVAAFHMESFSFGEDGRFLHIDPSNKQMTRALNAYKVRLDQMINIGIMNYMRTRMILHHDPHGRYPRRLTLSQILQLVSWSKGATKDSTKSIPIEQRSASPIKKKKSASEESPKEYYIPVALAIGKYGEVSIVDMFERDAAQQVIRMQAKRDYVNGGWKNDQARIDRLLEEQAKKRKEAEEKALKAAQRETRFKTLFDGFVEGGIPENQAKRKANRIIEQEEKRAKKAAKKDAIRQADQDAAIYLDKGRQHPGQGQSSIPAMSDSIRNNYPTKTGQKGGNRSRRNRVIKRRFPGEK